MMARLNPNGCLMKLMNKAPQNPKIRLFKLVKASAIPALILKLSGKIDSVSSSSIRISSIFLLHNRCELNR